MCLSYFTLLVTLFLTITARKCKKCEIKLKYWDRMQKGCEVNSKLLRGNAIKYCEVTSKVLQANVNILQVHEE